MRKTIQRMLLFFLAFIIIGNGFSSIALAKSNTANLLKPKRIVITKQAKYVSDSFNGVSALYRKGSSDGSSTTYSCAAFVKKYYKKVYNTKVDNLFYNHTPHAYGDSFVKAKKPRVGDIAAVNTSHGTTHWAIVKKVNSDNTVTLIEQNWKWRQGGKTVTVVNRSIKTSSAKFYRLKSQKSASSK